LKKEQMDYWQRDHAWFAAFAPADDPEIAVVVLNEHGGHGGSDAAPAASGIIEKYFELKRGDGTAFGPDWSAPPPREAPPAPPPPLPLLPPQQQPAGLALTVEPDAGVPINLAGTLPAPP
jgi:penicillin-binding protein 2